MSELNNEALSPDDMRKIVILRETFIELIKRRYPLVLAFFMFTFIVAAVLTLWLVRSSAKRFEARTDLSFYPKHIGRIQAVDVDSALQIFARQIMFEQLANQLGLPKKAGKWLRGQVELVWNKKQPNRFQIYTKANSEKKAIEVAELFAKLCISEYIKCRNDDLLKWRDAFLARKKDLQERGRRCDEQISELNIQGGTFSLEQEMERLWQEQNSKKRNMADLKLEANQLLLQCKPLDQELSRMPKGWENHAEKLRTIFAEQRLLAAELNRLRQLYTEKNPKLIAAVARQESLQENYLAFLKQNKLPMITEDQFSNAESLVGKRLLLIQSLEKNRSTQQAIIDELAQSQLAVEKLRKLLPRYEQLKQEQRERDLSIRDIEDSLSGIVYLQTTTSNELFRLDQAYISNATRSFSKKNIVLILIASMMVAGIGGIAILAMDFLFGKVHSFRELAVYNELMPLGQLTDSDPNEMFFPFQKADFPATILFEASVNPIPYNSRIEQALDWNLMMAGKTSCRIKLIPAPEFTFDGENHPELSSVSINGNSGKFPLENPDFISPFEMQLLQSDIQELKKMFDVIIISGKFQYLKTIPDICDGAVLMLTADTTTRGELRRIYSWWKEYDMPIATIFSPKPRRKIHE